MVDYELNELRREFLDEARTKVSEMEGVLLHREEDPTSLERLAYLAHQLKGSGGSYGYQRISEDAAAMERTVERHSATTSHGNPFSDGEIKQRIAALRSAIERAIGELE